MWTPEMGENPDDTAGSSKSNEEHSEDETGAALTEPGTARKRDQADATAVADEERQQILDAMEEHYSFPGDYKIVVIAKVDGGFKERLIAHLDAQVDVGPYRMRERKSSKGNYVSYHLQIHVESAVIALERKHDISRLDGVHVML
jgi:putative lipoic acid-binding regulatory protein